MDGLTADLKDRLIGKNTTFHGMNVWEDSRFENSRPLMRDWERDLIAKEVLKTFEIGEVSFITPRYFADSNPDLSLVKDDSKSLSKLLESIERLPAYPVFLGNENLIRISQELERAGLVIKVTESEKKYNVPKYAYLVSPNVFQDLEKKIAYSYSAVPVKEFGDISLTDRIFWTLGRARLYTEKLLPEIRSSKKDFKAQFEEIIDSLEKGQEATLGDLAGVFKPLTTLNILQISDGKAKIDNQFDFVVKLFAEFYYNLTKYPELTNLTYPSKKAVEESELSQVKNQIEVGLSKMFT